VFSLSAVGLAEARFGGDFGSRGYRTYQTLPKTPAAPNVTQQRTAGKCLASRRLSRPGRGFRS